MAIEKVVGFVTDVTKHSDRQNIVSIFAREQGRLSLLAPAGNGRTARVRNASLMPLSVIEADINLNAARELSFLRNFSRARLWKDLYFNPVKSAIGMFLTEFLNTYTRHSPADATMWNFCVEAVSRLDGAAGRLSNFHLAFLVEFMSYAGIRPDLSNWCEESWLDMRGGAITRVPPMHRDTVAPAEATALPLLARMNLRTFHLFRLGIDERRRILSGLLHYYAIHFPGMENLRSPSILTEVFS